MVVESITVSASDSVGLRQILSGNFYCHVGRSYVKPDCKPGEVCNPVEGSFCTE